VTGGRRTPLTPLVLEAVGPARDPGYVERTAASTLLRRFVRQPRVVVALAVIAIIALAAVGAPAVTRYDPFVVANTVAGQHVGPSASHLFGTDRYGRDVFTRVVYGGRVSLAVGLCTAAIAALVGTAFGAVAGYTGGALDALLMRFVDAMLAIPRVLLLVLIAALWGSLRLPVLIVVLALTGWFHVSRLVRAEVIATKATEFAVAARAMGVGHLRLLLRHILPHVLSPVLVSAALGVGSAIVAEAGLSFLGLGLPVPTASWGSIIHDGTDALQIGAWWVSVFPGIALVVTVLSVNVVADGLRAALNPRQLPAR
jgi:peptide/nickel transport system permease protein